MFSIKLLRALTAPLLSSLCVIILGCGGGPANLSPQPSVCTISISPRKVALQGGNSVQFRAALTGGAASKDLQWLANGVLGGNSAAGTISKAGLYTAPQGISPRGLVVVISAE